MGSPSDRRRPTVETGQRLGRPPRDDDAATATRERLLAAAVSSCVELGFEGVTVADIAKRAEVSAPAIYNHFDGKVELLVAAGRWALDELTAGVGVRVTPAAVARTYLAPEFADTRRLLSELHLAAQRHPEVADLLAKWHGDHGDRWMKRARGRAPVKQATVKTFFALLLGLCQIDSMPTMEVSPAALEARVMTLIAVLFPDEEIR